MASPNLATKIGSLICKLFGCLRGSFVAALRNTGLPARQVQRHSGKPVRLINLSATISKRDRGSICFKAAEDWDFHVISHTWSLGVRSLSEQIGKQIGDPLSAARCSQGREDNGTDAYNQAFEQADFSHDPCYQQLIEFFQLLATEKVERIWFDALCINQTDEDEKDKEISNMTAYYSQSKGCYVLTHGVGEGYQLLGKPVQVEVSLPRWFTRVWTYQEFLLPKRLTFIVEDLDREFIAFTNQLIKKDCLCRCHRKVEWVQLNAAVWIKQGFELEENLRNEGGSHNEEKPEKQKCMTVGAEKIDQDPSRCAECHSLPLIRKAPLSNHLGQPPHIYFVDREAYLGVMQSHCYKSSNATVPDERYPAYRPPPWKDKRNAALQPLRKLYRSLSRKVLTPLEVIEEVGNRHCSREEDRVLSILGLLGVELSQLRTGKGLAMQVAELAKVCSLEMLLELCGMDVVPCCTIGMSWAPDFTNPSRHSFWSTHVLPELQEQQLQVAVERQQVCADGSIKLLAKVVSGHLLAITALPAAIREMSRATTAKYRQSHPQVTHAEQPTHFIVVPMPTNIDNTIIPRASEVAVPALNSSLLPHNMSLESCCFIPLDLYAAITDQSTLNLNFFFNWQTGSSHGGSFHIPIDLATQTHDLNSLADLAVSFPIQMVLLGGAPTAIKRGDKFNVIMVCLSSAHIGEGEEQLHKVGMLYLTEAREWGMQMKLFEKASMSECLIGGFGTNLSHYVSLEHDASGEFCLLDGPPGGHVPIRKSW